LTNGTLPQAAEIVVIGMALLVLSIVLARHHLRKLSALDNGETVHNGRYPAVRPSRAAIRLEIVFEIVGDAIMMLIAVGLLIAGALTPAVSK
jgi:hypothetical protein